MAEPAFTEPTPIPCLFTSGIACEIEEGFVRMVAWTDLPSLPHEPHERRIIARLVLPAQIARQAARDLQKGLRKGGN